MSLKFYMSPSIFFSAVSFFKLFLQPTLSVHITAGPFLWNGHKTQLLFDVHSTSLIFVIISMRRTLIGWQDVEGFLEVFDAIKYIFLVSLNSKSKGPVWCQTDCDPNVNKNMKVLSEAKIQTFLPAPKGLVYKNFMLDLSTMRSNSFFLLTYHALTFPWLSSSEKQIWSLHETLWLQLDTDID